jgi:4-hydroxy-3-methylbut-2-enyl diphosphate reductase
MKVIRAKAMGMCFGVRDALRTIEGIEDPSAVTIRGELVHNEEVLSDLTRRRFRMTGEGDRRRVPATPTVLITAHGLSDRERAELRRAGREIVDTTCPLVRRAHEAAVGLAEEGRLVIVAGRPGHVEVRGLTGDLPDFRIVRGPEDVRRWETDRLGVVFQTTTTEASAGRIVAAVRDRNPDADVRVVDTICRPTKDRQAALAALLGEVQALVVVGGRNSNNTRALVRRARAAGVPATHVQGPEDLDPDWFEGLETVGLTAGTSTPERAILRVEAALGRLTSLTRLKR